MEIGWQAGSVAKSDGRRYPFNEAGHEPKITEILHRIRQLEEEIEAELKRRREELHADFENRRVHLEREMLEQQRRFKMGLLKYVSGAECAM